MFGDLALPALQNSLISNSIADLLATPSALEQGKQELNPLIKGLDPKTQKGLYPLYGALASLLVSEGIKNYVPKDMQLPAMILANLLEIPAANSVGATWRLPIYSGKLNI